MTNPNSERSRWESEELTDWRHASAGPEKGIEVPLPLQVEFAR